MLKRNSQRLFSLSTIICLVGSCSVENEQLNCIYMNSKDLPLFLPFPQITDSIFLARDIEYLDHSKNAYYYDGEIFTVDRNKYTPQLVFITDTSSNKILRQSINYLVEHSLSTGHFTKQSVKDILSVLKQKKLPFLEYDPKADLGSHYTFKSQTWICRVRITQPNKISNNSEEISIDIEISQP